MQTRRLAVMVALLGLATVGCESNGGSAGGDGMAMKDGLPTPVPITRQVGGNSAALTAPGVTWVQSQAELEALGSEELNGLGVDFSKESLVVFALGEQSTGGYWAHITGVQKSGNKLYVQGLANQPAADAATTQALTYPYAAAVIPVTGDGEAMAEIESVVGQDPPGGE